MLPFSVVFVTMETLQTHCYTTGTVTLLWKRYKLIVTQHTQQELLRYYGNVICHIILGTTWHLRSASFKDGFWKRAWGKLGTNVGLMPKIMIEWQEVFEGNNAPSFSRSTNNGSISTKSSIGPCLFVSYLIRFCNAFSSENAYVLPRATWRTAADHCLKNTALKQTWADFCRPRATSDLHRIPRSTTYFNF
jgi:hypothetical protein